MQLDGTNLEDAKIHNRRVVIEAIRLHGKLTRVEIARLTKLTAQTVTNITRELELLGWIQSHSPVRSGRGQPAIPLSINPDGACSIGIHLDQGLLNIIVVDLAGMELLRRTATFQTSDALLIFNRVVLELQSLREELGERWHKILGFGWAMPGPFDVIGISSTGPTTMHGWENINVSKELERIFQMPIWIANDATAAALGERLYGEAQQLSSFVYLFINKGLGAGLYLNGKIYDGHSHNAGEIGHIIVQPAGRLCFCGNHGCLERYLSLQAAYEMCNLGTDATPEQLLALDPDVLGQWLEQAVPATRQAINIVECLFDAQTVILGGMIPESVLQTLVAQLPPYHQSVRSRIPNELRVRVGKTGRDSAALGAAALPIMQY